MLLLPTMVFAKNYTLDDAEIKRISIPDNWYFLTQENFNSVYEEINIPEAFYNTMVDNNYYFVIMSPSNNMEIILTKKEVDADDFSNMDDNDVLAYATNTPYSDKNLSIYKIDNHKYLVAMYVDTSNNINYIYNYLTVINNTLYQFKIQKTNINFTDNEKETFINIIDSLQYNTDINNNNEENKSIFDFIVENKEMVAIGGFILALLIIIIAIIVNKKNKKTMQEDRFNTSINYHTNSNNSGVTHLMNNNIYDSDNPYKDIEEKKEEVKKEIKKEDINPLMDIKIEDDNKKSNN